MGLIRDLLRSKKGWRGVTRGRPTYVPYGTAPRYKGGYPFGAPRGVSTTTSNSFLPWTLATKPSYLLRARSSPLSLYEDRRLWHPLGANAWPRSITSSDPRIVEFPTPRPDIWRKIGTYPKPGLPWKKMARESQKYAPVTTKLTWEDPYKMIICLKRKARREIMNALGMAGKTGFKKPKYTQFSYVKCF